MNSGNGMICPDCQCDVEDMICPTCDDLMELSGKMISDSVDDPDGEAMRIWTLYGMGQKEFNFGL